MRISHATTIPSFPSFPFAPGAAPGAEPSRSSGNGFTVVVIFQRGTTPGISPQDTRAALEAQREATAQFLAQLIVGLLCDLLSMLSPDHAHHDTPSANPFDAQQGNTPPFTQEPPPAGPSPRSSGPEKSSGASD